MCETYTFYTYTYTYYISCQMSCWIKTAHQPHQQECEPQQILNYFTEFIKMTGN